jgi:hypothetical protein
MAKIKHETKAGRPKSKLTHRKQIKLSPEALTKLKQQENASDYINKLILKDKK